MRDRFRKEEMRDDADNAGMDKPGGPLVPAPRYESRRAELVFGKEASLAREMGMTLDEWFAWKEQQRQKMRVAAE